VHVATRVVSQERVRPHSGTVGPDRSVGTSDIGYKEGSATSTYWLQTAVLF
jgi:hypothetical protein